MKRIDNDAADALRAMETTDKAPQLPRLRNGWTQFLMSLMHRAPKRIELLRIAVSQKRNEIIEKLRTNHPNLENATDEEVFSQAYAEKMHKDLVSNLVSSLRIGTAIAAMHWRYVRIDNFKFGLLSGDRPLMRSNGVGLRNSFVVLPTSPNSFFLAAADLKTIDGFLTQKVSAIEKGFNDAIVRQSEEFVLSNDERQSNFIRRRIGQAPHTGSLDKLGEVTWSSPYQFEPWELV